MNISCFITLSTEHSAVWFSSDREMGESAPPALLVSSVVSDGTLGTTSLSQGSLEPPRKEGTPRVNGRNEASLTEALERQAGPGQVGLWTPWLYNRCFSCLLTPCFPTMLLRLILASLASVSREHPSCPSFGHEHDEALISGVQSPRHWPCHWATACCPPISPPHQLSLC